MGLKYLWNMVNLLQFIIFMRTWLIGIPDFTDQWLLSLKTLALFEFLPTDAIKGWLMGLVGMDEDGSGEVNEQEVKAGTLTRWPYVGTQLIETAFKAADAATMPPRRADGQYL